MAYKSPPRDANEALDSAKNELNYEELRNLAMEKAQRMVERLYPPTMPKEREFHKTRLTNKYYKEMISRAE